MTVSTIHTAAAPTDRRALVCTWVPVRGKDGRTRMEMRWSAPADDRRVKRAA